MSQSAIAGLILSGGESSRMGTPKALLEFQGETFLDGLLAIFAPVCAPVLVVLGHDEERIRAGLRRSSQMKFVVNPDPERGMLSSLQCGLRELPTEAEAVIFTPVDFPKIRPETVARLAQAFEANHRPVTVPCFQGRRGHPVCVSQSVMHEILALPPSAQARDVIRRYEREMSHVEGDDPGILTDVDFPHEYRALRMQARSPEIL